MRSLRAAVPKTTRLHHSLLEICVLAWPRTVKRGIPRLLVCGAFAEVAQHHMLSFYQLMRVPRMSLAHCIFTSIVSRGFAWLDSESEQSGGSTGSPLDTARGVSSALRPRAAAKRARSGAANGSMGGSAGCDLGGGGGSSRPAGGGKAPRSHVATEQRRRDRINEGCATEIAC